MSVGPPGAGEVYITVTKSTQTTNVCDNGIFQMKAKYFLCKI